jgi:copper chaperone
MSQATLEAPDISCDHCIQTIERAVNKLPGARFLSGNPEGKIVTVEFDPSTVSLETIEAALEDEGYPVKK